MKLERARGIPLALALAFAGGCSSQTEKVSDVYYQPSNEAPQKSEAVDSTKALVKEESLKLAKLLIAGDIDPYLNALAPSIRQTYSEGNNVTLGSLRESLRYFRENCKNPQLDLQRINIEENTTGPRFQTRIYFQQTCPPYDRVSKNPIEGVYVNLVLVDGKPTPLGSGPFSH